MKKLFQISLFIMISFNVLGQRPRYSGFIGKYPITFVTDYEFPEDYSYYSYTKQQKPITLNVKDFKNHNLEFPRKIVFYESDKSGEISATLTFENFAPREVKLYGVWTDLIKKKSLKVELEKDNDEVAKKINKEDSDIIKNHLRKLKVETLVDKYTTVDSITKTKYDAIVNKILRVDEEKYDDYAEYERVIKKILLENKVTDEEQYQEQYGDNRGRHWGNGNVYYSPDETFKIFVFDGEDCGAHCNPWYDSFIQLKSGKILCDSSDEDDGIGFTTIISLFKTGTNTYGAIQTSWSGGTIARQHYYLEQFSIINNKLIKIPLKSDNKNPDGESESDGFNLSSASGLWANLLYNRISNKIQFYYERMKFDLFENENISDSDKKLAKKIPKQLLPMKDDDILVVKGEFEITDSKIVNYKEWYEKKKESHDEN